MGLSLRSEEGIVSCFVVQPWVKLVKGDSFPVLAAFLQPRYFLLLPLFGTILRLSLHPSLASLLRIYSRHRGSTSLFHLPPPQLFGTIPRL